MVCGRCAKECLRFLCARSTMMGEIGEAKGRQWQMREYAYMDNSRINHFRLSIVDCVYHVMPQCHPLCSESLATFK